MQCSQNTSQPKNDLVENVTQILVGTWVNSEMITNKYPKGGILNQFRPISGFSIAFDSTAKRCSILIEYGEQKGEFDFEKIILSHDTLIGVNKEQHIVVGRYDRVKKIISSFNLVDTNIYPHSSQNNGKAYIKISNCFVKCSIEEFALGQIYASQFLVDFNTKKIKLDFTRNTCACNGVIGNLPGYKDYQILDAYKDSLDQQILKIALYNIDQKKNNFFYLVNRNSGYVLIKKN